MTSLPTTLYFTIIFLVGEWHYADFATSFGQNMCIFYCLFGVGIFAMPIGLVTDSLSRHMESDAVADQKDVHRFSSSDGSESGERSESPRDRKSLRASMRMSRRMTRGSMKTKLYITDNSELKADVHGLGLRRSPNIDDLSGGQVPWGKTVHGIVTGDFLQTGKEKFLPMKMNGIPVLIPGNMKGNMKTIPSGSGPAESPRTVSIVGGDGHDQRPSRRGGSRGGSIGAAEEPLLPRVEQRPSYSTVSDVRQSYSSVGSAVRESYSTYGESSPRQDEGTARLSAVSAGGRSARKSGVSAGSVQSGSPPASARSGAPSGGGGAPEIKDTVSLEPSVSGSSGTVPLSGSAPGSASGDKRRSSARRSTRKSVRKSRRTTRQSLRMKESQSGDESSSPEEEDFEYQGKTYAKIALEDGTSELFYGSDDEPCGEIDKAGNVKLKEKGDY